MPVPTVSYITANDVQAQTLITNLINEDDANVEKIIQIAEDQIDAFVGPQQHHPDDTNTDRVFPRFADQDEDGAPVIPYQVSRATLRQVEWLYTQWFSIGTTSLLPSVKPVSQESVGSDGSYSATYAGGGVDFSASSLCDQAKQLLSRFVSRSAAISTSSPFLSEP